LPSLLANLTDEMLRFTGGYDVPNQRGDSCMLSIALQFTDGTEDGFGFIARIPRGADMKLILGHQFPGIGASPLVA